MYSSALSGVDWSYLRVGCFVSLCNKQVYEDYIHKVPVIFQNFHCESQTLLFSNLSRAIAAAASADEYWNLQRSDSRNTDTSAHDVAPFCGISLGWLTLPAPETGEFAELLLLCPLVRRVDPRVKSKSAVCTCLANSQVTKGKRSLVRIVRKYSLRYV